MPLACQEGDLPIFIDRQLHFVRIERLDVRPQRFDGVAKHIDAGGSVRIIVAAHKLAAQIDGEPFGNLALSEAFGHAVNALRAQSWNHATSAANRLRGFVNVVRIDHRDDGGSQALQDVGNEVRREWIYDRRKQVNERFYADWRKRYEVTVEGPTGRGDASGSVAGMRQ